VSLLKYICLKCFHTWTTRFEKVKERQCSRCKGRAAVELSKFQKAVEAVSEALKPLPTPPPPDRVVKALLSMSELVIHLWYDPILVTNLHLEVFKRAGIKRAEKLLKRS
jgi:hypothetical protein